SANASLLFRGLRSLSWPCCCLTFRLRSGADPVCAKQGVPQAAQAEVPYKWYWAQLRLALWILCRPAASWRLHENLQPNHRQAHVPVGAILPAWRLRYRIAPRRALAILGHG